MLKIRIRKRDMKKPEPEVVRLERVIEKEPSVDISPLEKRLNDLNKKIDGLSMELAMKDKHKSYVFEINRDNDGFIENVVARKSGETLLT